MGDRVKLKLTVDMIKIVSDKEIKEALFDIDSSKAGPNGYTFCFLNNAWDVIGTDICLAVREFFVLGRILGEVNATLIALVPKIDTPNKVSDFRPMACCNIIYKCISKILTNRIKEGLSKVVSLNQRAFIPGRHIQDNILITQELLKGYNKKNGTKICAMKIDIQKAYDTITWEFLKEIMLLVRFHETMVSWIMTCISSASFSICINGEIKGFFKGGKGLRQGDPMSPYLFTLVMEVFNMLIMKNIRESGQFKFQYGCKDIKLTHMCFADDLFVMVILALWSINVKLKEDMLQILPFKCGKLPLKYLGVPLLAKRLGAKDCQSLIDKVERKARFAWKFVSRPKEQGCLGFKPMHKWNEEAEVNSNDSHGWKELMRIRDKIKPYVKFRVGDGKTMSMKEDGNGQMNEVIDTLSSVKLKYLLCLIKRIEHYGFVRVEEFLRNYMKNNVLNVHPASSTMWDVLKAKYEKPPASIDTYRADAFHKRHHDDHSDDHLEGEKGLKKQKTTKGSSSANVTSSSKPTTVQRTKTSSSQPQQQKYDGCSTVQEKYLVGSSAYSS
ncbi:RNA-directed DNA polymerase, eukaryota, reverse transcriptase zinc-binding domain protein [Tanacetum coccineum]|uniref:RNA-directed DNA polymerase, eukaryota, reverse transcriptase zinc-binding domain protein n=1 Tax=Tanacetum coccineum TaxID=301880 RepID=A0ABQ5D378_9ASTR